MEKQEPDFSKQFCEGSSLADVDTEAIQVFKLNYAKTQNKPEFKALSDRRVLTKLGLLQHGRLRNAALILFGKEAALRKHLPQAGIILEYRSSEEQRHCEQRDEFRGPAYLVLDQVWKLINSRNAFIRLRKGAPKRDSIPLFNEETIREALSNAIAHRDYQMAGETLIKQYPHQIDIVSSGGLPNGVTIDQFLKLKKTPRNNILVTLLVKSGIVANSGQGIKKIFRNTLAEGKLPPDYSQSDDSCVRLSISAFIEDRAFAQYIQHMQGSLDEKQQLTAIEMITLNQIRLREDKRTLKKLIVLDLIKRDYIEGRGANLGRFYVLGKLYFELSGKLDEYHKNKELDIEEAAAMASAYLEEHQRARMRDFVKLFEARLDYYMTKRCVEKMVELEMICVHEMGTGAFYTLKDYDKVYMDILREYLSYDYKW